MGQHPHQKSRTWLWVSAVATAFLLGFTAGLVLPPYYSSSPENRAGATTYAPSAAVVNETPALAPIAEPPYLPTPADFQITAKVLEKKCFGSAGCHIVFRAEPHYVGQTLTPAQAFTVIYEVHGSEGPLINQFTFGGGAATVDSEEFTQTGSTFDTLTISVVEVF